MAVHINSKTRLHRPVEMKRKAFPKQNKMKMSTRKNYDTRRKSMRKYSGGFVSKETQAGGGEALVSAII